LTAAPTEHSTYDSSGHPKAKGVRIRFSYPTGWQVEEGERPNIVKKFTDGRGRFPIAAMLIVKEVSELPSDYSLSRQEAEDLFSAANASSSLPDGSTLVASSIGNVEGLQAGIREYTMLIDRLGLEQYLHVWTVSFFVGNKYVEAQFSVGGRPSEAAAISMEMERQRPVFFQMANSIVLPDQWENSEAHRPNALARVNRTGQLPTSQVPQWTFLAIGVALTWFVGLLAPLIARHLIVRRPLEQKPATTIAAINSAALWLAAAAMTPPGERRCYQRSAGPQSFWIRSSP
jgi:hypothetical protein